MFSLWEDDWRPHFFYPRKERLYQRFDCHLPLLFPIIRFQIRQLIIQMIDGPEPLYSFIRNGIFRIFFAAFGSAFNASEKYRLACVQQPAKMTSGFSRSSFL